MIKPLEILHKSLNSRVLIEIRGDRSYRGILDGYDVPHMNLVIKNAEEIVRDPETKEEKVIKHEMVIVRGDNIIYVSPP